MASWPQRPWPSPLSYLKLLLQLPTYLDQTIYAFHSRTTRGIRADDLYQQKLYNTTHVNLGNKMWSGSVISSIGTRRVLSKRSPSLRLQVRAFGLGLKDQEYQCNFCFWHHQQEKYFTGNAIKLITLSACEKWGKTSSDAENDCTGCLTLS